MSKTQSKKFAGKIEDFKKVEFAKEVCLKGIEELDDDEEDPGEEKFEETLK